MEALRLMATASEGKLSIAVPEAFNNQELEVIVLMHPKSNDVNDSSEELKRRRMEDFGKAPFPDFPTNKYDVYHQ